MHCMGLILHTGHQFNTSCELNKVRMAAKRQRIKLKLQQYALYMVHTAYTNGSSYNSYHSGGTKHSECGERHKIINNI